MKEVNRPEDRDSRSADPVRVGLLEGHLTDRSGPPAGSAGGPRYRLRPSVEPFVDRHGTLCFVRPGASDLVVRDPDAADVRLVLRLRGVCDTAGGLARHTGIAEAEVQRKLDSLVAAGLVLERRGPEAPPLAGEDGERFSRQLPYLAELGDEVRLQRRLRGSTVAVLGCGGVGTWVIAALACVGVGRVVLVDDDHVALSNLNRQILYTRRDVGASKADVSARWLRDFDPAIAVTTLARRISSEADVDPVVALADVVVLAADWPPYELARWVNAACIRAAVPFIVAGQLPPVVKVGPTYMPGHGACFTCHETALARESSAYEDYVAFRASDPDFASTLGPASCVAGGLIGLELLHLLTGHDPVTRDCAVLVHMRTLEVRHEPVRGDATCRTCKHLE
jgi:molybdopterin/thiamine biosynthesis adenylyltransferase